MATPLINGVNYSWAQIKLVLFGVPVIGVLKINYKKKQKKELNFGVGSDPISVGYGNKDSEGSIELYLDEWRKVIAASAGSPLDIPPFDIQVVFGGSQATAGTDVLQMCQFLEDPMGSSQGDTKVTVNIPLLIADIVHI